MNGATTIRLGDGEGCPRDSNALTAPRRSAVTARKAATIRSMTAATATRTRGLPRMGPSRLAGTAGGAGSAGDGTSIVAVTGSCSGFHSPERSCAVNATTPSSAGLSSSARTISAWTAPWRMAPLTSPAWASARMRSSAMRPLRGSEAAASRHHPTASAWRSTAESRIARRAHASRYARWKRVRSPSLHRSNSVEFLRKMPSRNGPT